MKKESKIRKTLWEKRKKEKICVYCGNKPVRDNNTIGCSECLQKKVRIQGEYGSNHKDRQVEYRKKIKKIVIDKYGGKCNCCNETELLFLTVDHINNDGHIERKEISNGKNSSSSTQLYLKLKRDEKRADIQILCFNCNIGRSLNEGICPHHKPAKKSYDKTNDLRNVPKLDRGCKIEWPSNEDLIKQVNDIGFKKTAELLNIHKDSIRYRLKRRNLLSLVIKRKNQYG